MIPSSTLLALIFLAHKFRVICFKVCPTSAYRQKVSRWERGDWRPLISSVSLLSRIELLRGSAEYFLHIRWRTLKMLTQKKKREWSVTASNFYFPLRNSEAAHVKWRSVNEQTFSPSFNVPLLCHEAKKRCSWLYSHLIHYVTRVACLLYVVYKRLLDCKRKLRILFVPVFPAKFHYV